MKLKELLILQALLWDSKGYNRKNMDIPIAHLLQINLHSKKTSLFYVCYVFFHKEKTTVKFSTQIILNKTKE